MYNRNVPDLSCTDIELPYFACLLKTCIVHTKCIMLYVYCRPRHYISNELSKTVTTYCLSVSRNKPLFCEVLAIIYLSGKCFAMIKDNFKIVCGF